MPRSPEPTARIDYDAISARYDDFRGAGAELAEIILAEAGPAAGARILDVGCGTGNVAAALARLVDPNIVGVDRSLGMLTAARTKLPDASWIQADSAALPLRAEAFDCVLMIYLLHHVANFAPVIQDAYRLLRHGPLIVLTVSHKQIDESFACRFFPSYAAIDKARFPTIPAIMEAMQEAGFSDVTSRTVNIAIARVTFDESYLEKVENKHVSTYYLMRDEEFRRGLEKMREYIREHAGEPALDHQGTLIVGRKRRGSS